MWRARAKRPGADHRRPGCEPGGGGLGGSALNGEFFPAAALSGRGQIGAYNDAWPDIHMTPEDGVTTHVDVRGGLMIPVHWATFNLALHDWSEPADRAWREAKARDVKLAVPRPGERVDVDNPPSIDGWWQAIA